MIGYGEIKPRFSGVFIYTPVIKLLVKSDLEDVKLNRYSLLLGSK